MVQNPHNKQPYHTVNSSKQKDTVNNRQSHQLVAASCKDNRGKAGTRQSCQPKSTSCRTRSPTPHPCQHGNTCDRTFSKRFNKSQQKNNNSFQIDTVQIHHNSPHSTENSSLQDHFWCIPGPSTSNHVKPSCIPILSKLLFQNATSNNKDKPQKCYKGVSHIPIPQGRKKHTFKTITKDSAHNLPQTTNACNLSETPKDIITKNNACNCQSNTKTNTQDQHPSITIQPRQYETPKPTVTSPLLPTLPFQNSHHHRKQYISRPLSAINSTRTLPLLPNATIPRPQHMANSKQWPELLTNPACSRSPTTTCSKQQPPMSSPTLYHYTSPAYHGSHQGTLPHTDIPSSHHININWQIYLINVPTTLPEHQSP